MNEPNILFDLAQRSIVQPINWSEANQANCSVWVKRDDLLHRAVSGNKLFKLFHYVQQAVKQNATGLISFGGAYSNHLYALSKMANAMGMPSVGVIRGEELNENNSTLQELIANGMQLKRVDRSTYRQKMSAEFLAQLKKQFPGYYVIPEGGAGLLGAQGFADYAQGVSAQLLKNELVMDSIWLPAGSGTTAAGLAARWPNVHAVCALALEQPQQYMAEIAQYTQQIPGFMHDDRPHPLAWHGFNLPFGKLPRSIMECCLTVWRETGLIFDPIYGGKVLFALQQAFTNGLRNQQILVIHTGGIQGWRGFFAGKQYIPSEFKDAVKRYLAQTESFILDDTDLTLGISVSADN